MKSIFEYFIQRPLVVNLIMVMVLLFGAESLRTGSVQFAPFMEFGIYSVTTVRAGVSPEKMELSVTVPLEEELLKVEGIKQVISNSVEGLSLIQVNADASASNEQLTKMYTDLQKAIDRAAARLPSDLLEKPQLHSVTNEDEPLMRILVSGSVDEALLRQVAKKLQHLVREVAGVSAIELESYRDREVHLLLDPLRMNQLGVAFEEIEQAVRRRNVSDSGGSFDSFVGEQDVVALGEFEDPKDVGEVIVRASGFGDFLRVKDLATVVMDYAAPRVLHSMKGQPGIMLNVKTGSDTNEITVTQALRDEVLRVRHDLPAGVSVDVVYERERITTSVMEALLDNALAGAVLIALVLILFFPWRATLWVVVGLPTAVLLAFLLFPALSMTLSNTVLVAMVLMLGLLVDDAIVVSESIYRYHEQGYDTKAAALQGTLDVAKPVFTGALTTLLAFSPMLFVGGMEAKFMWIVPGTVVLVIIGSLLECYFLLPAHIAHSLSQSGKAKPKALWFGNIETAYRNFLNRATQYSGYWLLVVSISFVVCSVLVGQFIKFDSYPAEDSEKLFILAELPTGSSLQATSERLSDVEAYVRESLDARHVSRIYSIVGHHNSGRLDFLIEGQQSNWGKIKIELVPSAQRDVSAPEIVALLQPGLDRMAGFERLSTGIVIDAPPTGFPVELQVIGDGEARGIVADTLLEFLHEHRHVSDAWSNYTPGKSVINLALDYEKLAAYGLEVSAVTKAIKVAFDGYIFEELQTIEERIRYRLQLQQSKTDDLSRFRSLLVQNSRGEQIPLRSIASFEVKPGQESILHYAGSRTETIYGSIDRELSSVTEINQQLEAFIAASEFGKRYPSVRVKLQGEYIAQQQSAENMGGALLLILVSIFFLMIILFNSMIQPLLVMLVIPLAFVSVMVVFLIHNLTLSVPAAVGFMGLAGVLVNSSLVLIDQVNRLHQQAIKDGLCGADDVISREVIIEGAVHRLRPIFITAMTTAAGLGPAAYGVAGTHPTLTPMIMVMFWGVVVGAFITLVTLPIFMAFTSDQQTRMAKPQLRVEA